MRKVYMSFLGTNDYQECIYCFGGKESESGRFVQAATVSFYCRDWDERDEIFIFLTDEARRKNWLDDGHLDKETKQPKKQRGLQATLRDLNLRVKISDVRIPEGKSESEIWQIFDIILEKLQDGDNVYFDITHAFRSIPMLALVVLNYAKAIKNIKVGGICYGAFEVLGHPSQVNAKPLIERKAPIFDLTPFVDLLDWTEAIRRFLHSGDAMGVFDLTESAVRPIKKYQPALRNEADNLKMFSRRLADFCSAMATCRGPLIADAAKSLIYAVNRCSSLKTLPALAPLIAKVGEKVQGFTANLVSDGIRAASWCMEHNLIQQAYTILQEAAITLILDKADLDYHEKEMRDLCNSAAAILIQNTPEENWFGAAKKYKEETSKLISLIGELGLAGWLHNLSQARNDLNHAGFRKEAYGPSTFRDNLKRLLTEIESSKLFSI